MYRSYRVRAAFVSIISLLYLFSDPFAVQRGYSADKSSPKEIIQVVWEKSVSDLVSGRGKGTYSVQYLKSPDGEPIAGRGKTFDVSVAFDSAKYRVELIQSNVKSKDATSYIIIYDGDTFAIKESSAQLSPHGEEVRVYPSKDGLPTQYASFFRFMPNRLPHSIQNVEQFLRVHPESRVEMDGSGNINVNANYPSPDYTIVINFNKSVNHYITSFQAKHSKAGVIDIRAAEWDQAGAVAYIKRIETIDFMSKPKEYVKSKLEYNAFECNPVIDPSVFTLASLKLKKGVRVLDINYEDKTSKRYYNVDRGDPAGVVSIRDSLTKLLSHPTDESHEEPRSPWFSRKALMIYSAFLGVLSVFFFYMRKRRNRSQASKL